MKRFWNVDQLAAWMGVPRSWLYERTRTDGPEQIPHLKLGKYVRFEPESDEFQAWLDHHRGQVVGLENQRLPQVVENKRPVKVLQHSYNKIGR